MLEKTLESPLDCKEVQPVHPKGDQSWVFIGRIDVDAETPILWPPDEKRKEAKGKGEKERYTYLKAEFQRTGRRDKKGFLSDNEKKQRNTGE